MNLELQVRIALVLDKHDRKYHEYRKTVHDQQRLRSLDEAHHRFSNDLASDMEEAYYKKIITDVGNVEAARIMRADGYRRDFVSAMIGLSPDEIDRLG